jgi:hypothetical protein
MAQAFTDISNTFLNVGHAFEVIIPNNTGHAIANITDPLADIRFTLADILLRFLPVKLAKTQKFDYSHPYD